MMGARVVYCQGQDRRCYFSRPQDSIASAVRFRPFLPYSPRPPSKRTVHCRSDDVYLLQCVAEKTDIRAVSLFLHRRARGVVVSQRSAFVLLLLLLFG